MCATILFELIVIGYLLWSYGYMTPADPEVVAAMFTSSTNEDEWNWG